MSLRRKVADGAAQWPDPVLGVNLRASPEDLMAGECVQMQNCVYQGGTRLRPGSSRLNAASLGSYAGRGIHKFYYGGASANKVRLIAYNNRISTLSDAGTESVLTSGMTADRNTQFCTWSITDKVYICNATDTIRSYDGTTFATVSGTAIPAARWLAPIGDRLMAITANGIERTDARVDNVWSSNSSWATIRPSLPGLFTCIHPLSLRGSDSVYSGLLALQAGAYYLVTGTFFGTGTDFTAGTASTGEDSRIQLLDPYVGTSSPFSVCSIPGIGTAWFTSDLNVYLLPEGSLKGRYIGDRLRSTTSLAGIESTNTNALSNVWMTYFDRYLVLGIPTGGSTYPNTQFWMDMYSYTLYPSRGPVWYGPMVGQTIGKVCVENHQGDFGMTGIEGNSSTGVFGYRMRVPGYYRDAVGTADNSLSLVYQPFYHAFGNPSSQKYLRSVHMDLQYTTGTPTLSVYDIDGTSVTSLPINVVG